MIGSLAGIAARSFELPIATRILLGLGIAFLVGGALLGLAVAKPVLAPAVGSSKLRKRLGPDEWRQPSEKHVRSASRIRLQIIDAFRGINGRKARQLIWAVRLAGAGVTLLLAAIIIALVAGGGPGANSLTPSPPKPSQAAIVVQSSIDWPAWIQAAAALAIVGLTLALARFTRDYVREMRRTNELQADANRLTRSSLAIAQGQIAPRLFVIRDGRDSDTKTYVIGKLLVRNEGGGPADHVVVKTAWGDAPLEKPLLAAGQEGVASVRITWEEWQQHDRGDPPAERVRYRDAEGQEHDDPLEENPPGSGQFRI